MKDDCLYIGHILDFIRKIRDYTSEGKDMFWSDSRIQDAVIRNIEIMGEAAKRVSQDCKVQHPNIPWKEIMAMRDVLIHDYAGVVLERVWNVVEKELPPLEPLLKQILLDLKEKQK